MACNAQPVTTTLENTTTSSIIASTTILTEPIYPSASTTTSDPSFVEQLLALRIELLPTLPDGRPATFVGVTTDYAGVEVDTLTGEIVRPITQIPVGGVWRLSDGSAFLISDASSEPAGGSMFWAAADEEPITPEIRDRLLGPGGWYVEPSPTGPFVAITSSYFTVTSPDRSVSWLTF